MPGSVYTVASGKGGVGKTTTTVNLGVALWQDGNSVAVVDADLGMANLSAVLGIDPETTLHDVLAGETILEEAIVEAKGGDLLVVAGSRDLEGFAAANPQKLKDVLENLAARCDYVIVDTGAGLGYEDVLPLGLADAVILVSSADPASLGDTRKTAELAGLVETPVLGVVVTRAVEATDSEAIAAEIGAELLGTIPEDPAVMEATVAGDPLASHAPKAEATSAYMELGRAILEAGVPPSPEPDAEPASAESGGAESSAGEDQAPGSDVDEPEADAEEPPADDPETSADGTETDELTETDEPTDTEESTETAAPEGPEPSPDDADDPAAAADDPDEAPDPATTDDEAEASESTTAPDEGEDATEPSPEDGADVESEPVTAPEETEDDAEADEESAASDEDESDDGSGGLRGWLGRLFS